MANDREYMKLALAEAEAAAYAGEVPVGAVLVDSGGGVLSRAHNLVESLRDPTAHAEILAIRGACRALGNWRLTGATLFVTLEPCAMCAGAVASARISRLVCGAPDSWRGAAGSVMNVPAALGAELDITIGIMEDECRALLREFFASMRARQVLTRGEENAH